MKKILVLLCSFFMLSACIPIRVISKWDPDTYNGYKAIQAIQKKETIGHTDAEQREKDLLDCGVKNFFDGNLDLNVSYPGMTTTQVIQRMHHIYQCMESKEYIIHGPTKCTDKGKPTGFCN